MRSVAAAYSCSPPASLGPAKDLHCLVGKPVDSSQSCLLSVHHTEVSRLLYGMQGEHEVGEHASPEEPWPGMSAEAQHVSADDSATWHADRASLQRALDEAIAQPIEPSRRPMWTDTSGEDSRQNLPQCLARQSVTCPPPCLLSLAPTQDRLARVLSTYSLLTDLNTERRQEDGWALQGS